MSQPPASTDSQFLRDAVLALPPGVLACVTVPAPLVPPEVALAQAPPGPACLWAPPETELDPRGDAPTLVTFGATATLTPRGSQRLTALRDEAQALLAGIICQAAPGSQAAPPRLIGGLAFAPGTADAAPWTEFGDASFTLPRWSYCRQGAEASLTLTLRTGHSEDAARAAAELLELRAGLSRPPLPLSSQRSVMAREEDQDEASWIAQIEAIRQAIHAGRFRKIVAARRSLLAQPLPADLAVAVLAQLRSEQPGGTRFALRRGAMTFLGATPERLLRKHGASIYTEALAGSIPAPPSSSPLAAAAAGARLRGSAKDREEHELVVQDLRERLGPLCQTLDAPAVPEVRALRRVLHLLTPVRGVLRQPLHALDLLAVLHPTPAVGGVPREESVRWITSHEAAPRGLYAGPVGWFDAHGDGEFMVAIRSGLLTPQGAYLYAGAGITGDSDPRAEYAETALKMETLLRALRAALAGGRA